MKETTDTVQVTKTSTPVSEKIAIIVMMLGALSVGIGLFFVVPINIGGGGGGTTTITPQPLIPTEITSGVLSDKDVVGIGSTFLGFYRENNDPNAISQNNVQLAVYEPAHSGSDPWGGPAQPFTLGGFVSKGAQDIIGNSPLELKMKKTADGTAYLPPSLFTLTANTGVYTLCLPATTLTNGTPQISYFYDKNGTPYSDKSLQIPASQNCATLLANSYAPTEFLSDERLDPAMQFNLPYPGNLAEPNNLADQLAIYFVRNSETMMTYLKTRENNGSFIRPGGPFNLIEGGKSPLALSIGYFDSQNSQVTIPGRALTIVSDLGAHTLCVPETTLTGEWDEIEQRYMGHIAYYYDINGTPYLNSWLTQRVTDKPCSEILAKAYKPNDITNGYLNQPYPNSAPDHFQIYSVRDWATLGVWENNANQFIADGTFISLPYQNSNSPAVLIARQVGENPDDPILLPSRSLTLKSDAGTHTLCIPAINIPAAEIKFWAYDNQGNPYSDGLLQKKVTCAKATKYQYRPNF